MFWGNLSILDVSFQILPDILLFQIEHTLYFNIFENDIRSDGFIFDSKKDIAELVCHKNKVLLYFVTILF